MRLLILLMACTRAVSPPPPPPPPARPRFDPPRPQVALAGPRVAEVLTAAAQVRDVISVGEHLWLATAGGLVRASQDLVEEARFTTLDGLPSIDCWQLAADGDRLYVATPHGVMMAHIEEGRPVEVRLLPLARARAVAVVNGVLWAGTWGDGVMKWDGTRFLPTQSGPAQVNRLYAEGTRLWAATAQGLLRVDSLRWLKKQDGLPDDFVWDVGDGIVETMAGPARLDGETLSPEPGPVKKRAPIPFADGRLVLGEDTVSRLGPDGAVRSTLQPLGLPSADVTALAVGEDALYVGTFDAGVAAVRWDRDQGLLAIEPIEGLIDARIDALLVRRDGGIEELWVGTARGATRVREGKLTHFTAADGLPDDHVNAIFADGDVVRLVTTRGWAEVTPTGTLRVTPESGLPSTRLQAMARTSDGALWVGGAHGAARLGCATAGCANPEWTSVHALSGELPDDFVTALLAVGDDLWVGTYSSGMARRVGSRRWTALREPELPSNWINAGALASWRERVWAGSVERGLMISPRQRAGEDEGRWSSLGVSDGLPSADVTALAADEDGLWVGTRGGVARVVMPVVSSWSAR